MILLNVMVLQTRLINNIRSTVATLVTSPRRYGKTSLVLNVFQKNNIPFAYIDLYAELDEQGIGNTIFGGIGSVLYKLESVPKKALKFITDFFAGLSISFSIKGEQVSVDFSRTHKTTAKLILSALKELDEELQKRKKKVVLFLDEFQRISEISKSMTIEGVLRNVAQQAKNICFVFSGSNRHLLETMFNDRARPFYNLCDRIVLDRIAEEHYIPFIQIKAQKKWSKHLYPDVADEIFDLVE